MCMTMEDIALIYGEDYDSSSLNAGDGKGIVYTNWDKSSIVMCKCDIGYFGSDCAKSKLEFIQ